MSPQNTSAFQRREAFEKGGDTMDKNELWAVFTQTGRVEDYLRYRDAVMLNAPKPHEEQQSGTDGKGTDRP